MAVMPGVPPPPAEKPYWQKSARRAVTVGPQETTLIPGAVSGLGQTGTCGRLVEARLGCNAQETKVGGMYGSVWQSTRQGGTHRTRTAEYSAQGGERAPAKHGRNRSGASRIPAPGGNRGSYNWRGGRQCWRRGLRRGHDPSQGSSWPHASTQSARCPACQRSNHHHVL